MTSHSQLLMFILSFFPASVRVDGVPSQTIMFLISLNVFSYLSMSPLASSRRQFLPPKCVAQIIVYRQEELLIM